MGRKRVWSLVQERLRRHRRRLCHRPGESRGRSARQRRLRRRRLPRRGRTPHRRLQHRALQRQSTSQFLCLRLRLRLGLLCRRRLPRRLKRLPHQRLQRQRRRPCGWNEAVPRKARCRRAGLRLRAGSGFHQRQRLGGKRRLQKRSHPSRSLCRRSLRHQCRYRQSLPRRSRCRRSRCRRHLFRRHQGRPSPRRSRRGRRPCRRFQHLLTADRSTHPGPWSPRGGGHRPIPGRRSRGCVKRLRLGAGRRPGRGIRRPSRLLLANLKLPIGRGPPRSQWLRSRPVQNRRPRPL